MTDKTKKEGIEELEKQLKKVTDEIRAVLGGRKDKKDLSDDEKM